MRLQALKGIDVWGGEGRAIQKVFFKGKLKVKRGSYDLSLLLSPSYSIKVLAILD